MPSGSNQEAGAIVVVRDAVLASSLELALLAHGLTATLHDPDQGLEDLPLHTAMTLVVDRHLLAPDPASFVEGLRARPWDGLVILMTGDGAALRRLLQRADRIAVLEMPFVGADLIAAIRAVWPAEGSASSPARS